MIDAFNRNMPFDQFTIEQLAGDLLPEPTLEQRVATGFNRCNVTTSEGGSIDDEYYVRYAVDRVETTSTVWLGLTAGCAACHDHKFDPLTQKEFYQLFSYFFSLTEKAMDGNALLPPPVVKVPSPEQLRTSSELATSNWRRVRPADRSDARRASTTSIRCPTTKLRRTCSKQDFVWFDDDVARRCQAEGDGPILGSSSTAPDHPVFSGEKSSVRTGDGLTQHFFTRRQATADDRRERSTCSRTSISIPRTRPRRSSCSSTTARGNIAPIWGADKGHGAGRNRRIQSVAWATCPRPASGFDWKSTPPRSG